MIPWFSCSSFLWTLTLSRGPCHTLLYTQTWSHSVGGTALSLPKYRFVYSEPLTSTLWSIPAKKYRKIQHLLKDWGVSVQTFSAMNFQRNTKCRIYCIRIRLFHFFRQRTAKVPKGERQERNRVSAQFPPIHLFPQVVALILWLFSVNTITSCIISNTPW